MLSTLTYSHVLRMCYVNEHERVPTCLPMLKGLGKKCVCVCKYVWITPLVFSFLVVIFVVVIVKIEIILIE